MCGMWTLFRSTPTTQNTFSCKSALLLFVWVLHVIASWLCEPWALWTHPNWLIHCGKILCVWAGSCCQYLKPHSGQMISLAETITLIYLLHSAKPSAQGACVCVCLWVALSVCMVLYEFAFVCLCLHVSAVYTECASVCVCVCASSITVIVSSHVSLLLPVAVTVSGLLPTVITDTALQAAKTQPRTVCARARMCWVHVWLCVC